MTVNNVNGIGSSTPLRSDAGKGPAVRADKGAASSASPASEAVSSKRSDGLQGIEAALARVPEVDHEKISALRQAIADGSYQVDTAKLADRLIQLEASLNP